MKKDTFLLNIDLDDKTKSLSDQELGQVIRKILKYVKNENIPQLNEKLEIVFDFIKVDIDKNNQKYQDRCEKSRLAILQRWNKKTTNDTYVYDSIQSNTNDTDNDNEYDNDIISNEIIKKEIKTKKKFIKPSFDEVNSYCLERNNKIDAQRFIDYYEANGWKVGRNSMKDWKAAIRTWEKNDGSFSNKQASTNNQESETSYYRRLD